MAISSSTQPSLRARILPRFPAQVIAGTGISITKSGGVYTFAMILENIPPSAIVVDANRILGRDMGAGPAQELTVGSGLGFNGVGGIELAQNQRSRTINVQLPVQGTLAAGSGADYLIPFGCIIQKVTLLADPAGNLVLDIWKNTYANFPPTVADTITGTAKPTISAGVTAQLAGAALVGWTTAISPNDILRFSVVSRATITRLSVCVDVLVI